MIRGKEQDKTKKTFFSLFQRTQEPRRGKQQRAISHHLSEQQKGEIINVTRHRSPIALVVSLLSGLCLGYAWAMSGLYMGCVCAVSGKTGMMSGSG